MRMKRIHRIILGERVVMSKFFQEGKISLISVREKRESSSWYDFNICKIIPKIVLNFIYKEQFLTYQ